MRRGGQVSIEFLIITGFSMLLLIPLLVIFQTQGADIRGDLIGARASAAMDTLAESAERVYYAGPPTRETVTISLPDDINAVDIESSAIIMEVTYPRYYDAVRPVNVPLVPTSLGPLRGRMQIRVEATATGVTFEKS